MTRPPYFVLLTVCIGSFVLSRAVLDRYSTIAAVVVSVMTLAIPPVRCDHREHGQRGGSTAPETAPVCTPHERIVQCGLACRVLQCGHG